MRVIPVLAGTVALMLAPPGAVWGEELHPRAVSVGAADEAKVVAAMRDLGFSVVGVKPLGPGRWAVQVDGFDPGRANGAMRGLVAGTLGGREARSAGDGGGDILGGGGATAGGSPSDKAEKSGGGKYGGGGTRSSAGAGDILGGGGATAGGSPSDKAEKSGGGKYGGGGTRSGWVNLSVAPDGALSLDAASLRALGLSARAGQAGNLVIR